MPLPTPRGQSREEFINSCMSSEVMKREFKDNKQRLAVCFSQFKHSKRTKGEVNWSDFEDDDIIVIP